MIRSSVHHGTTVLKASNPLFPAFLTTFRAPFCVSHREQVQQCRRLLFVWCGGCHHSRRLSRCLQQGRIRRIESTSVSIERKVPIIEVFAGHIWFRFPDSHVFRTRSRHRLSHRSHSLCESRHCRIHSGIRRLLSDILHPRIEFLKLTSQQVNFLSSTLHGFNKQCSCSRFLHVYIFQCLDNYLYMRLQFLQIFGISLLCISIRWEGNVLVHGSGPFERNRRRTIVRRWKAIWCSEQNKVGTAPRRSLLVRSENCARQKIGTLADMLRRKLSSTHSEKSMKTVVAVATATNDEGINEEQ